MKKMAAGEFKMKCLAIMDEVRETGEPVVVTKRGKPVVKVVPVPRKEEEIFGYMAGKAKIVGDILNTIPVDDWEQP